MKLLGKKNKTTTPIGPQQFIGPLYKPGSNERKPYGPHLNGENILKRNNYGSVSNIDSSYAQLTLEPYDMEIDNIYSFDEAPPRQFLAKPQAYNAA